MAVTVIFGKGGSGKTTAVFSQIRAWTAGGGKAILIVPDQATYLMERRFAASCDGRGFMETEITGFARLAYHVFQERGKDHQSLSSLGQKIVLQRLLHHLSPQCTILQTAARQPNFVTTMSRFLAECRSFRISPDDLRETADNLPEGTLSRKLHDISLVYDGYMDFLNDHFGSADDVMTLLIDEIPHYSFARGARIWVDGFQWFTPQQLAVLQAVEPVADSIIITLTMDPKQARHQRRETALFHRSYVVYEELRQAFPHMEVTSVDAVHDRPLLSFTDPFFQAIPRDVDSPAEGLTISECSSLDVEVDAVARRIIRLCQQEGLRYRDVLLLARSSDTYYPIAERILERYGIPLFGDYRRPMTSHPIVAVIDALLDVFHSRWAYEPLFRLLKSDLFPISRRDADTLENYCLAFGIQGYHWLKDVDWTYGRNAFLDEQHGIDEKEQAQLDHINDVRKAVRTILWPFWETAQKDHSLKDWCTALYHWLVSLGVPDRLRQWQQDDEEAGRVEEAKEHEQVWKRIVGFLDEIVRLCGDDVVSLDEFSQTVQDGLEELKFSLIPPTLDHVTLTSIDRGYSMRAKVVFICGLNDGVFPQRSGEDGLLNDDERKRLRSKGLQLGPSRRTLSFQERFFFYLAATRAESQIYLSYCLADGDGGALEPSTWIRQLLDKGYVDAIQVEKGQIDEGCEPDYVLTLPASLQYIPEKLRPAAAGEYTDDLWWGLYDWAWHHGYRQQAVQAVQGMFHRNAAKPLPRPLSWQIFAPSGKLRGSVTKFERYRSCPFAYFSEYGLGLEERPLYRFAAPDLGMLVHGALKILGDKLMKEQEEWKDLPDDEIASLCRQATDELAPYIQHDILMSNAYFQQIKERLIETLSRTVRHLCRFSKASDFHMEALEMSFGRAGSSWQALNFTLKSGLEVVVSGQIDRMDTLRIGDTKYIVVMDYKSGNKRLDITKVLNGLELQLLTYMLVAMLNVGGDAQPAAVLYCYVRNDKSNLNHLAGDDEKEKEYNKNSKMTGFFMDDASVMKLLDKSMTGYSDFVNLQLINKGMALGHRSHNVYDETAWSQLLDGVRQNLYDIATDMDEGQIPVRPVLVGQESPCRYCVYHAICRFDPQLPGNAYEIIRKEDADAIIAKANGKGGNDHGLD